MSAAAAARRSPRPAPLDGLVPGDDAGLTLIELVVYLLVAGVLLSVVAGILVAGLSSNAATRDRDLATGTAQAISTSLATAIRNASDVTVQHTAATPSAPESIVVRARVATGTSGWECQAWAVVDLERWTDAGREAAADGVFELRHRTYPTGTSPDPDTGWGVLANHVEQLASDAGATPSPTPTPSPSASPLPYFEKTGDRLDFHLAVATAEDPALSDGVLVPVSGTALAQARDEGTPTTCW